MKILHNLVLVEPLKQEQSKGGLIIPVSQQNKNIGKVILVGEKCESAKVGDTVKYHANCGVEINYLGKQCLFLNEEHEVIAIL